MKALIFWLLLCSSLAVLASAVCPATLSISTPKCVNAGKAVCTIDYFSTPAATSTNNNIVRLSNCLANGDDCCDDPCYQHTSPDACAGDSKCIGGGYGPSFKCVVRAKVCATLTPNVTACDDTFFCKMVEGLCTFDPPAPSGSGPTSTADCPALHPFPVAMIVLIFITFIGSIIIVGVTLIIVRKRAEREEQEEEERNAEAAIAALRKGNNNRNTGDRNSVATGSQNSPSPTRGYTAPQASPPQAEPVDDGYGYSQQNYYGNTSNTAATGGSAGGATNDGYGQYAAQEGGAADDGSGFEIQYDEYGGYYAADGTYYDAQGNAYGADGQPIGGTEALGDDDY